MMVGMTAGMTKFKLTISQVNGLPILHLPHTIRGYWQDLPVDARLAIHPW
jgi:hypothetical protein